MKPIMLVSQSNSGSSWLADCFASSQPDLRYFRKEFFNPIMNHKHNRALSEVMGCELHECVMHLARERTQAEVDRMIEATWAKESYNFTKENYVGYALPQFAEHFQLIGLDRWVRWCFPPERIRVMQWYNAWFWSLLRNGRFAPEALEFLFQAYTPQRRAVVAWYTYRWQLDMALFCEDAPVLQYSQLIDSEEDRLCDYLADQLANIEGLDVPSLAEAVLNTRQPPKASEHQAEWADALDFGTDYAMQFHDLTENLL